MYPLRSLNVPLGVHVPQFGNPCSNLTLAFCTTSTTFYCINHCMGKVCQFVPSCGKNSSFSTANFLAAKIPDTERFIFARQNTATGFKKGFLTSLY